MIILPSLLLLVHLVTVDLIIQHHTPLDTCDFNATMLPGQSYSFANENWPDTYDMGVNCRWTFNCVEGYACRLQCNDVGLPATVGCYMDKLLVYTTSNTMLGGRVYCGRATINLRSLGTKITMKLITSKYSPGGRFRCKVSTEKWKTSWYFPTVMPFHIRLKRLKEDRKNRITASPSYIPITVSDEMNTTPVIYSNQISK